MSKPCANCGRMWSTDFNKVNINRKGVKFSVLAGNPLPTMCKTVVWNDGVVPVPSAKWKITDNAESKSIHTDLTGTSDFSSFVKPRLAIGPKGNHNPEMPNFPNQTGQNRQRTISAHIFINAAYQAEKFQTKIRLTQIFTNPILPKPLKSRRSNRSKSKFPSKQAKNFGLTFMAASEISATLYNEKGEIVGKNLTKTPEANAWFRSIYIDKNVRAERGK